MGFSFHHWCTLGDLSSVLWFIGGAACTDSVSIYVDPHDIQLKQGKVVLVDNVPVKLPHTITSIGASIVTASSMFIQVKTQLRLLVILLIIIIKSRQLWYVC